MPRERDVSSSSDVSPIFGAHDARRARAHGGGGRGGAGRGGAGRGAAASGERAVQGGGAGSARSRAAGRGGDDLAAGGRGGARGVVSEKCSSALAVILCSTYTRALSFEDLYIYIYMYIYICT
jgi:hypothetical protein